MTKPHRKSEPVATDTFTQRLIHTQIDDSYPSNSSIPKKSKLCIFFLLLFLTIIIFIFSKQLSDLNLINKLKNQISIFLLKDKSEYSSGKNKDFQSNKIDNFQSNEIENFRENKCDYSDVMTPEKLNQVLEKISKGEFHQIAQVLTNYINPKKIEIEGSTYPHLPFLKCF